MLRRFCSSSSSTPSRFVQKNYFVVLSSTTQQIFASAFFSKLSNSSEYHNISEAFIEDASILADKLLDKFEIIEDSNMKDGVLEILANKTGTFVLNKQAPLHQLWYSSPISGPHHYDYDLDTKRWLSDKDKHDLQEKIERELSKVCGSEVKF